MWANLWELNLCKHEDIKVAPMRSKARGLAQHGGTPAGWRRVTLQARVWFCMWWTVHAACPDQWGRPKARGLTQHGGPAGWLEESDPAGCDLYVTHYLPRSGADLLINVHKSPSWATSRKEGMAWNSSRPMPSLWLALTIDVWSTGSRLMGGEGLIHLLILAFRINTTRFPQSNRPKHTEKVFHHKSGKPHRI